MALYERDNLGGSSHELARRRVRDVELDNPATLPALSPRRRVRDVELVHRIQMHEMFSRRRVRDAGKMSAKLLASFSAQSLDGPQGRNQIILFAFGGAFIG